MTAPPSMEFELSDQIQAVNAGGLGVTQQLVKQLGLAALINTVCPNLKLHLPYTEADHVLKIAYNLLAGGTGLEHLELRRKDKGYLNALGSERTANGYDTRNVHELLGRSDVRTTIIYKHVLIRGGKGIRSAAEGLAKGFG